VGALDRVLGVLGLERRAVGDSMPTSAGQMHVPNYGWGGQIALPQAAQEGFRASAVVYRCAQTIAADMASLDLGVQIGDDELDFADPIAILWNKTPNEVVSAAVLKTVAALQLELAGQSFLYVDRGPTGEAPPAEMWNVYYPVEVVVDDRTRPMAPRLLGFRAQTPRGLVPLLPAELLWLRYPDPSDPWGCMSPLRAASWAVDLDSYAKQWQIAEFRNGVRPAGVIYLGDVADDVYDQAVADFEARRAGPANAGKHIFAAGPVKGGYERIGLTPAEMSYIESRGVNRDEIMFAYGIPGDLWGAGATFENRRQAKVSMWSDTIVPKLELIEAEIDRQQMPEPDRLAKFDLSRVEALQEQRDSLYRRTVVAFRGGLITRDEGRDELGMDPVGGDKGGEFVESTAPAGDTPDRGAAAIGRAAPAAGRHPLAARLEAQGQQALARLADRQERAVLRRLERGRNRRGDYDGVADLFGVDHWTEQTRDALDHWLFALTGADPEERLAELAGEVVADTLEALRAALAADGDAGASDRVSAVFDDLRGRRATSISRAEVARHGGARWHSPVA